MSSMRSKIGRVKLGLEHLEDRRMMAVLDDFLTNEHVDLQIRYNAGVWGFGPYDSDSDLAISNEHGLLYGGDSETLDQLRPTTALNSTLLGYHRERHLSTSPASRP